MRSGRNLGKERDGAIQLLQYLAPTETNTFAKLCIRPKTHVP